MKKTASIKSVSATTPVPPVIAVRELFEGRKIPSAPHSSESRYLIFK
ncbi:MAG TPA: hypothetical protein PKG90_10235 [Chitinophagaceae bacterium]|nr:hypothetical protein [Chitinophagaceae bacterium]HNU15580.1 hypothetical protein [Chitinophagaceae bacterium]